MHFLRAVWLIAALSFGAAPFAAAQDAVRGVVTSPILVIDSESLYAQSLFGQRVLQEQLADTALLSAENRRIEAELAEEERTLTEQRSSMPAEDFRAVADAFDARVQEIRRVQDSKEIEIARFSEQERVRFFNSLAPVLERILRESNALVILEKRTTFAAREVLDVTDRARQQADQIIGNGADISVSGGQPEEEAGDQ